MKLSKHANARYRQRGFSKPILEIVLKNGRPTIAPGGATRLVFGVRESQQAIFELKQAIKLIERAKNRFVVVRDEEILTVCNTTR